eukprot:1155074-Pelagomonas_calceolata.AAC.1
MGMELSCRLGRPLRVMLGQGVCAAFIRMHKIWPIKCSARNTEGKMPAMQYLQKLAANKATNQTCLFQHGRINSPNISNVEVRQAWCLLVCIPLIVEFRASKGNLVHAVRFAASRYAEKRTACRDGRALEQFGMVVPKGVAGFFVGKLRGRAKLVPLVHERFKPASVCQVGAVVSWSRGVMWVTVVSVCGLQRKPVKVVEDISGIWKCNVCGVRECCSACAASAPLLPIMPGGSSCASDEGPIRKSETSRTHYWWLFQCALVGGLQE